MKLTIEIIDKKYTVEMDDSTNFADFMEEVKNISKCLYHEEQIKDYWA